MVRAPRGHIRVRQKFVFERETEREREGKKERTKERKNERKKRKKERHPAVQIGLSDTEPIW
jgi:hypothetical protein